MDVTWENAYRAILWNKMLKTFNENGWLYKGEARLNVY
jgi:hypothetical protein